jgi:hypothetical protein
MKIELLACGLIASLSSLASATALTYKLLANEKACFYTNVEQKGAKIAFYFAVSIFRCVSYLTDY